MTSPRVLETPQQQDIYGCYSNVLNTVRQFAQDVNAAEILSSPTAPQLEFAASQSIIADEYVLPASQTFQKELASLLVGNVYCVAPCYRRESPQRLLRGRHLNTFYQIEFEFLEATQAHARAVAQELLGAIAHNFSEELLQPPAAVFDRIDEIDLIEFHSNLGPSEYDTLAVSLSGRLERPAWILHTPQTRKPRLNQSKADTSLSTGFDLLLPHGNGEILSGGLRDHNELEMFWVGRKIPTGNSVGFGIGLERLLGYLLGEADLRRVQQPHFAP